MPGGRRSDRISQRDLEVLEFIARFGLIPRGAVAAWAGTARSVTLARERRLREAGLIAVHRGFAANVPLLSATRVGLRACGHVELVAAERVYHRHVKVPLGDPRNMLSAAELREKADSLITPVLGRDRSEAIADVVDRLEVIPDCRELTRLLIR